MNYTHLIKKLKVPFLAATVLSLTAAHAYAVDLMAVEGQWTPPGGASAITMWGFAPDTGDCLTAPSAWSPGPVISDSDLVDGAVGMDLTINLRNCLPDPVSIIIPGQPATFVPVFFTDDDNRQRVRSFTEEAPADGGISQTAYAWNNVKSGTYLYQSGTHPAKQVQMGLYGQMIIGSYAGTSGDVALLYSEIDPALHDPVPMAATPRGYNPRYYLVNGSLAPPVLPAGDTNMPTVLRFLNAGFDFHIPALNGGYMNIVAEDGNPYPFPQKQYSVDLTAGKTMDALWLPSADGAHVIYDRRGNGMVASLTVSAGAPAPVALDDVFVIDEDVALVATAGDPLSPGVLDNDPGPGLISASLISAPAHGTLIGGLAGDGSFSYQPDADFNGVDMFSYKGSDGSLDSNAAIVTITVNAINDIPVADAGGPYVATLNVPLMLDGSGSSDVDGDPLTFAWGFGDLASGTGEMVSHTYTSVGSYVVSLVVNDGVDDSVAATATVEVVEAVNSPPVAVADSATVVRNSTGAFIELTANDSDVDGNLKDALGNVAMSQIIITTGPVTTRGGSVTVVTNGVTYIPKRNFRGTDTFNYYVTDLDRAMSNEVSVKINVVR